MFDFAKIRYFCALATLSVVLSALFAPNSFCQESDSFQLKLPTKLPTPKAPQAPAYEDDLIMISPNPEADKDDITDALKEVNGTIVDKFGADGHIVYVVKTEKGKLAETEKKLSKDKNFHGMQRCNRLGLDAVPAAPAKNDPYFPQQWHLKAMNAINAWKSAQGSRQIIGIIDSGVNKSCKDLSGKVYPGINGVYGNTDSADRLGHGTTVATTAAALTNNRFGVASPAYNSYIYPASIVTGNVVSEMAIVKSIYHIGSLGIKIINISAGEDGGSFCNKATHPALHEALQWFYEKKGGLAFLAAGNQGRFDGNRPVPYMMMVSAINSTGSLASFSNYGYTISFTAPGQDIVCVDHKNTIVTRHGTSFAAPLCAAAAAVVWSTNPRLKNSEVQQILAASCYQAGMPFNYYFGYGMPNIERAVSIARSGQQLPIYFPVRTTN